MTNEEHSTFEIIQIWFVKKLIYVHLWFLTCITVPYKFTGNKTTRIKKTKYLKKKQIALIKSKAKIILVSTMLNYTYCPQCCNKISFVNWSACYPMIYFFKMKIKFQFFLRCIKNTQLTWNYYLKKCYSFLDMGPGYLPFRLLMY